MAGPDPVLDHPTPGMHIWGWMLPPELEWLSAQAREMSSIVEIGSLHGRSAFALLTACAGPVYCIDPWDDVKDECYGSFMGNCEHFANLVAIRGYSPAAGLDLPAVDMVFVDGDHSYEAIMADIRAWQSRTRKLMCGHDYHSEGYPDVTIAVHEIFGDRAESAPLEGHEPEQSSIWMVRMDG